MVEYPKLTQNYHAEPVGKGIYFSPLAPWRLDVKRRPRIRQVWPPGNAAGKPDQEMTTFQKQHSRVSGFCGESPGKSSSAHLTEAEIDSLSPRAEGSDEGERATPLQGEGKRR